MVKIGKLFRRNDTHAWFVKIDGKQRQVAPSTATEEEAVLAYAQIIAHYRGAEEAAKITNDAEKPTSQLVERYLADRQGKIDPKHHKQKEHFLLRYCKETGDKSPKETTVHSVQTWVDNHQGWGPTTKHSVIGILSAFFKWAEARSLIPTNPIKGIIRPKPKQRDENCLITLEQHKEILKMGTPWQRDVFTVLYETGCRPSELLDCLKTEYDRQNKCLKPNSHKNAWRGKKREILLRPEAIEAVERLLAQSDDDTICGRGFGRASTVNYLGQIFKRYRIFSGLKKEVTLYSYRHSFVCRWVGNGTPIAVVASWIDDTIAMVEKIYSHLHSQKQATWEYLLQPCKDLIPA